MQIRKDNTNERLLSSAKELFLKNGFAKTSMREIASLSQIGLSNMYNYYKSKDEILGKILKPLINELYRMMRDHHDINSVDAYMVFLKLNSDLPEQYIQLQIDGYLKLLKTYHNELTLLFFKAQGSSYEKFMDDFTDEISVMVNRFINSMKIKYPDINFDLSQFTIHLHSVWMFSFLREIIMHNVRPNEMNRIVRDYITFECAGWRELMKK